MLAPKALRAAVVEAFSPVEDNSAQYFGVHHERNEKEGEHGLVEEGSEKGDEHADIPAQPEIGCAVTDLIRCDSEICRDLRDSRYAWIPD